MTTKEEICTSQPVFIVGSPRSGTTFLSAMLSNHSRLCCGPETQFFNKLDTEKLRQMTYSRNWVGQAVAELESLNLSGQQVMDLFGETVESVTSYLSQRPPAVTALLESLCQNYAAKHGKVRWVEKTPNHLLHLKEIRELYPQAPIIHIMRDPRDSVLSMVKLPWTSESYVENCYLWLDWYQASIEFLESDPLSLTLKYEDLVADQAGCLHRLCDFIGESYEDSMHDTQKSASLVSSAGEPWKRQVSGKLDSSRTYVWKRELIPELAQFSSVLFNDVLEKFGYPDARVPQMTLSCFPHRRHDLISQEDMLIEFAGRGIKVIKSADIKSRKVLFLKRISGADKSLQWKYLAYSVGCFIYCKLLAKETYVNKSDISGSGGLEHLYHQSIDSLSEDAAKVGSYA